MDGRTHFREARQASYVADFKGGQNFGEGQGYFDLETRVLEPLENPFGPKVLPMS
jgi:hypothetical protein